jgi:DCN1-like protein 1/2
VFWIALEIAIALWDLLIREKYKKYEEWFGFLRSHYGKSISKDTWNLFYEYMTTVADDLSKYDVEGT